MRHFARVIAFLGGLSMLLARAHAADHQAVLEQVKGCNKAAVAAYETGNFGKMKSQLAKAVALADKNGLSDDPVLAQTYALFAVLQVEDQEDQKAGVKYFSRALKIAPDTQIPPGMATTPVVKAFKQARSEGGAAPAETAVAAKPAAAAPVAKTEAAPSPEKTDKADKDKADKKDEPKAAAAESEKKAAPAAADSKHAEAAAREEKEKQQKEAAQAKASEDKQRADKEKQERAEKERLDKDKAEKEKQLADAKARMQQQEKDKAEKEKQLTDSKGKLAQLEKDRADRDKQLADAKAKLAQLEKDKADRDKQLTDVKAKLQQAEKDKADRDKQLADTKGKLAQLEKEKADRDKLLADAKAREAKEKEARDKAEKQLQVAEAREKERQTRQEQDRLLWNKQADGPDMPAHIPQPLYCEVPDEAQAGRDLFVHCVAQPSVKAKEIAFYYRTNGVTHYNSLAMERFGKGWFTTVISANNVRGKSLQYYAEARDGHDGVVATNGKPSSPNILMVRAAGAPLAGGASAFTPAAATTGTAQPRAGRAHHAGAR